MAITLLIEGRARSFNVYIPEDFVQSLLKGPPLPLLLGFHGERNGAGPDLAFRGGPGNQTNFAAASKLDVLGANVVSSPLPAEDRCVVALLEGEWDTLDTQFLGFSDWDITGRIVDEGAFARAVIDWVERALWRAVKKHLDFMGEVERAPAEVLDRRRIYFVGSGTGATVVNYLACRIGRGVENGRNYWPAGIVMFAGAARVKPFETHPFEYNWDPNVERPRGGRDDAGPPLSVLVIYGASDQFIGPDVDPDSAGPGGMGAAALGLGLDWRQVLIDKFSMSGVEAEVVTPQFGTLSDTLSRWAEWLGGLPAAVPAVDAVVLVDALRPPAENAVLTRWIYPVSDPSTVVMALVDMAVGRDAAHGWPGMGYGPDQADGSPPLAAPQDADWTWNGRWVAWRFLQNPHAFLVESGGDVAVLPGLA